MRVFRNGLLFQLALLVLLAGSALAAPRASLRIEQAWARATPPVARVAVGYLVIVNTGDTPDRLLRIDTPIAQRVEMHRSLMVNGMMQMRPIEGGAVVPAHGRLLFAPGGNHLMLINPAHPLVAGETFEATLVFERSGSRKVMFQVRAMDADAGHGMHMH